MEEVLLARHRVCPVCNSEFSAPGVRYEAIKTRGTDSDFHTWYSGPSPDHYTIIVCPECWYAAFAPDFGKATASELRQLARLRGLRQQLEAKGICADFTQPRTIEMVDLSLDLWLTWARVVRPPANRLAEAWLRKVWLARERQDAAREQECLEQAIQHFAEAYESSPEDQPRTDLARLVYLAFDLCLRRGDAQRATVWADMLVNDPALLASSRRIAQAFKERLPDLQALRQEKASKR